VPLSDANPGDAIAQTDLDALNTDKLIAQGVEIPNVPGQEYQFFNPDIDYFDNNDMYNEGPQFKSELTNQFVGTLNPSAEGVQAVQAYQDLLRNQDTYTYSDVEDSVGKLAPSVDYQPIPNDYYEGVRSASDFPLGLSTQGYDFSTYADPSNRDRANTATNQFGSTVSVGYGGGQVDPALAAAAGYTGQPSGVLSSIFGPTSAATQERLADEIADRARSTDNSAQGRANELNAAIQNVGGQELLDSGATLAGDQTMSLQSQFGTLTTTQVADQASLSQKGVPTGKGSVKDTRKVLDQAARDGNLGAYVDSFMGKYGGDLNSFQEKTGISNAILKDIEKIAAAKGS